MKLKWFREDGHKFRGSTCSVCKVQKGPSSRKGDYSYSLACIRVQGMMFTAKGATRAYTRRWLA